MIQSLSVIIEVLRELLSYEIDEENVMIKVPVYYGEDEETGEIIFETESMIEDFHEIIRELEEN
jgi:hypothetical protein